MAAESQISVAKSAIYFAARSLFPALIDCGFQAKSRVAWQELRWKNDQWSLCGGVMGRFDWHAECTEGMELQCLYVSASGSKQWWGRVWHMNNYMHNYSLLIKYMQNLHNALITTITNQSEKWPDKSAYYALPYILDPRIRISLQKWS